MICAQKTRQVFWDMRLTRESEYALRGLMFLARQPRQKPVLLGDIARAEDLPFSFVAKTFHKLCQHNLVRSHRGSVRGYTLARTPSEISVKEILEAVEGAGLFERCIFWDAYCSEKFPCPLHPVWQEVRPRLREITAKITLENIAKPAHHKRQAVH